jgi:hypothetical protein
MTGFCNDDCGCLAYFCHFKIFSINLPAKTKLI